MKVIRWATKERVEEFIARDVSLETFIEFTEIKETHECIGYNYNQKIIIDIPEENNHE